MRLTHADPGDIDAREDALEGRVLEQGVDLMVHVLDASVHAYAVLVTASPMRFAASARSRKYSYGTPA